MLFANKNINIADLNEVLAIGMSAVLGMEVTDIGDNYLTMKMPVDERTIQPYGILNGGASMALAETVASVACSIAVAPERRCYGVEINGNHVKSVKSGEGFVYGTASPVHTGKKLHVWSVEIVNENQQLVCIARVTLTVVDNN